MIMNGNTPKSLSAAGRLTVLALGLLLPLVPVNAQQQSPSPPDDRRDPRDQQIETLKKAIHDLEQQRRAEDKLFYLKDGDRLKKEQLAQQAQAEEQRARAVRFLAEEVLAQNRDSEQRRAQVHRLNIDEASPGVRKLMQAIEEITRTIEAKRQELQGLEIKLREAHVKLEQMRAEDVRGEAEKRVIRVRPDGEIRREPIIIKVDPSANPEDISKMIQEQTRLPIRVEIVKPEAGPAKVRNRPEPAAEPRPRERRESRPGDLEQKLERIMKEVEELRRELRSSRQ